MSSKHAAVFLDRDGVISELVFNPKTKAYEAPHITNDLKIIDEAVRGITLLQKSFKLFVVSNQPDYAKGTTTLETIKEICSAVEEELKKKNAKVEEFFYCYHHPDGVMAGYTMNCECRKPKPHFLLKAAHDHNLDLNKSWMIGDQDTDIECGQNANCKTVLILNENSKSKRGKSKPTLVANNLADAALQILNFKGEKNVQSKA